MWSVTAGEPEKPVHAIPILCKFWSEDGVWNGVAKHLPVAVFGDTFEEAMKNLSDALMSHFDSLKRADRMDAVIADLLSRSRDSVRVDEISFDSPLVKLLVALRDQEVLPLCQ
jgi:predicted RNase H-like HicB family nuclease